MDATAVTKAMNDHWVKLLDEYYDYIADAYIKHLSAEHDIPVEELEEKTKGLKEKVMKDAFIAIESGNDIKRDARKTKQKMTTTSTTKSVYDAFTHPELAKLCKDNKLPVKRKKQDMIDALVQNDNSKGNVVEQKTNELKEEIIEE